VPQFLFPPTLQKDKVEVTKEFLNHLSMAYGSLMELETHLQIAVRLEYLEADLLAETLGRCAEVGRMLNGLMRKLSVR
jgi:four helix bundle protein